MDSETRRRKLESYGKAYDRLVEALNGFPREMWTFKPSDGWSIKEIIVHISDGEANGYIRLRKLLAEPGETIGLYDQPGWARNLRYQEQSADEALEVFKYLRRSNYNLIKAIPDEAWANNTVQHPERGTVTLDWFLETYENHIPTHIRQMEDVYAQWRQSR